MRYCVCSVNRGWLVVARVWLAAACLGVLMPGNVRAEAIPQYPGYALVWHDEFNTDGPPAAGDWIFEEGFVRNKEAQFYRAANVRCAAGSLIIEARREEVVNPAFDPAASTEDWKKSRKAASYSSGSIKTLGKHSWTYGRFEMRARFDTDSGCWPAFWSVGSGSPGSAARPWPGNGELDIMEFYRNTLLANAAWASAKPGVAQWRDSKTPLATLAHDAGLGDGPEALAAWAREFHTWRMDWTPESIIFTVDGRLLNTVDITKTVNATEDHANPFHEPHHLILNLAIGGTSGGDPSKTTFPRTFEVDWVRVYQKETAKKPAYAGVRFRQNPEGVVVAGVQPGPFDGDGYKSPSLWRGDLVMSINGQTLDAAGYAALIQSRAAGDTLKVVYRRGAHADPAAAVPSGDPAGEERTVEVILQDAGVWVGTIGQGLGKRVVPAAENGQFEDVILAKAAQLGFRSGPDGTDSLLRYFETVQHGLLDPNSLPAVVQALQRPLSIDRVEGSVYEDIKSAFARPGGAQSAIVGAAVLISHTLDIPAPQDAASAPVFPATERRLDALRAQRQTLAHQLVRTLRDNVTPAGAELPGELELIRQSTEIVPLLIPALIDAGGLMRELDKFGKDSVGTSVAVPENLAARVVAAVKGTVVNAKLVDGELWVVGGQGPNEYNMDLLGGVYDIGGDDTYRYSTPASHAIQLIIDQAGNDTYTSTSDCAGPATASFGVSILVDRAGNDTYSSTRQGSIACGVFGVGILIDESGNDSYLNQTPESGWSEGVGFYGAGILLDRAGNDTYQAQKLSQGVGGPRGFGLICDLEGNDTYAANGPHFPSVYGTAGVYVGMSQGFGYGIRGYAAGGVGAIYDLGGDDSYSVGEFGQGCGYFQGLGILHDVGGDDRYVGSRYAQGTGAHQAAGILVDDAGNDSYTCPGPAGQGVAWDQTVAMLLDRGGNDVYTAGGLAQGSAAQQAIGMLMDLGGTDHYVAAGACQGQGGDNTYHFGADKVFSLSVLFDLGGGMDTYSSGRLNSTTKATGSRNEANPAASDLYGIFLDQ